MNVCEQHDDMYRKVSEIHSLIFGDPRQIESLGLRGEVARHERVLRTMSRIVKWIVGGLVSIAAAVITSMISKH